jgi:hypothetical protein
VIASALEMTMKKQLSRQTKRSRPVPSKVQTNRHPTKVGSRKRIGSTARANKTNGVRQTSPAKARIEKRVKPRLNENSGLASEKTSIARPDTKKRDLIRHEEAIAPMNGASRSLNRTWLEWSNATMAANLRTMEELTRCKSPIDLWAVSSRLALTSWFNLWPLPRRPESRPSV